MKFNLLSFGTLRRYEYFFRLEKTRPFIDNREQLLEAIEEHFANDLKVNPVDVIYRFLSTKKDQEQGDGYILRDHKGPNVKRERNARKELS